MIVVMAAGISANLTINPLEAVTTVTVQIVSLLTGDKRFDDPKTLAAFALGLSLLLITLALNGAAMLAVRRFGSIMNNIVKRRRKERLFICAALVSIVIAVFF